jgi:hypothetical protein
MFQRLDDGHIRVLEVSVLANQENIDRVKEPFLTAFRSAT